jgi:hypothetical protein
MAIFRFRSLMVWAVFATLAAFAVGALHLGWPPSVTNVALAGAYLFITPVWVNIITGGYAASRFRRFSHKGWWILAYGMAFVTICAPRLHWSLAVTGVLGALSVATAGTLLSIARLESRARPKAS